MTDNAEKDLAQKVFNEAVTLWKAPTTDAAIRLFELAVEYGSRDAKKYIGIIRINGWGNTEPDIAAGASHLTPLALEGDREALLHLFKLCKRTTKRGEQIIVAQAMGIFPQEIPEMSRITQAAYESAQNVFNQQINPKDQRHALTLLHDFANTGKVAAQAALSLIYINGWNNEYPSSEKAAAPSVEAAKRGEPTSLSNFFTLCYRATNEEEMITIARSAGLFPKKETSTKPTP